jgi:hypothetical protein
MHDGYKSNSTTETKFNQIKKGRKFKILFERKHTRNAATEKSAARLLDYLYCAFRTLSFTCPADYTLADVDWNGFPVFHLVDADWASVYAGFASSALVAVNNYFYHIVYLS